MWCGNVSFFFKQKTAYEMLTRDWSSDVCSSDLPANPTPDLGLIEATIACIVADALVSTDRGLVRMERISTRFRAGGLAVKVDPRLLPSRLMVWEGTHDVPLSAYGEGCLPLSQAFCPGEGVTGTVQTRGGDARRQTRD